MYGIVLATVMSAGTAAPAWGCHGCHGCSGGCRGFNAFSPAASYNAFSCYGCSGCYGSAGCYGSCYGYGGGYACYGGCYGCYGACYGCYGGLHLSTAPVQPASKKDASMLGDEQARRRDAATATVVVRLPEDAALYVDGTPCPLTSDVRSFDTPPLPAGQKFAYTIKAEAVIEGRARAEVRRVVFEAGQRVDVDFTELRAAAARRVTGVVPAGGR